MCSSWSGRRACPRWLTRTYKLLNLARRRLCDRLGKRDGQSIRVNANCQLDPLALSLRRRHHKSDALGFQLLIRLVDVFDVETNRTTAGLLCGVRGRRRCWSNAAAVKCEGSGSSLKLSPSRATETSEGFPICRDKTPPNGPYLKRPPSYSRSA